MKHSITELYKAQGSSKLLTKEAAEIVKALAPVRKALYHPHAKAEVTVYDVNGSITIYMFGEKMWFDTQEELDEYRAQYQAKMNAQKERKRIMDALIAELDKMSTEDLHTLYNDMFGVV